MDLQEALWNYRETIVDKWTDYTLSTYLHSEFFKREKDKFANPTGGLVRDSLSSLFLLLREHKQDTDYKKAVEPFLLLRSVQEFSPSQAVAPLNAVKHITREVLEKDKETKEFVNQLYDFEFAVDLSMLAAFDQYMACRERLYQVRINEIKTGKDVLTDSKCPSAFLKDISKNI